jgi:ElaB/YqjD/DUF883 family membrane-anchored ribosome-binding protein
MNEASTAKLIDDLRVVVADAEALLAATANDASEPGREVRGRASAAIEEARARLEELESEIRSRAKAAAEDAGRFVREKPWQSVGVAAAVGVVVGMLLGRR